MNKKKLHRHREYIRVWKQTLIFVQKIIIV
nr:MAG TPA: hypothetical protein [Caudoviricetes sp.]